MLKLTFLTFILIALTGACSNQNANSSKTSPGTANVVGPRQGDLSTKGGTSTVHKEFNVQADNPKTTDNERNNQPLGHMGTISLHVRNVNSGHSYPLDADVDKTEDGYELHRLYFVKGGWVDFYTCDLDGDYVGSCTDENGRGWDIEGEF
ncbi:MAG: hypothetical protein ABI999_11500 [Acidobacteriota bacterium]